YNEEYLTAGGNVSADVSRGASTAAAELTALSGREPAPIRLDLRSLFNPAVSYANALGFLLIGGPLLIVMLLGGYTLWYDIPVRGPAWLLGVATVAFVLATQAFGLLLIARTADLRRAGSLGALIFGPAAAFGGVTF